MPVLQIKIYLEEMPSIWRKFLISDKINFNKFHEIIQEIMGWENYHLYEFDVDGIKIGIIDEDVDYELEDAKKTKVLDYLGLKGQKFSYVYDFGDNWEHKLVIEEVLEEADKEVPLCLEGQRSCPLEDCGGISGYEEILEIKKDKKHPRYKELIVNWLGENFDPEKFDLGEVNKNLIVGRRVK